MSSTRMPRVTKDFRALSFIQFQWSSTKYIYKIASYSTYGFYSKFLKKFFILVILEGCAKNTPKIKNLLELKVSKILFNLAHEIRKALEKLKQTNFSKQKKRALKCSPTVRGSDSEPLIL